MGKFKTKQTLKKRIKITKSGKLVKGPIGAGHLKVKWNASKKYRKGKDKAQENKGHIKKFKGMLGKHAKS